MSEGKELNKLPLILTFFATVFATVMVLYCMTTGITVCPACWWMIVSAWCVATPRRYRLRSNCYGNNYGNHYGNQS